MILEQKETIRTKQNIAKQRKISAGKLGRNARRHANNRMTTKQNNFGAKYGKITENSSSDCLVSYAGHSLRGWLPLCRDAVGVYYSPSRLGPLDSKNYS